MRISWRDRFPASMLSSTEKVNEVLMKSLKALEEIPKDRSLRSGLGGMDCDEVYPNIFLGDGYTAKNLQFLKSTGITHVVNTAMGSGMCLIDTDEKYYKSSNITFLGFSINDLPGADISIHFESVANFIDDALASGGKVYVHCLMGISRSSTCIIAFLMLKRAMSAEEALKTCRAKRYFIRPNEGFLKQLAQLDVKLQERRQLDLPDVTNEKKRCGMS